MAQQDKARLSSLLQAFCWASAKVSARMALGFCWDSARKGVLLGFC